MTADSGTHRTADPAVAPGSARYLSGADVSFGMHPEQQTQAVRPPTSTGTAGPIEPSRSPETGQVFGSRVGRPLELRVRVTVANMPGRRRWSRLSSSNRTATVRVAGSTAGAIRPTRPRNTRSGK